MERLEDRTLPAAHSLATALAISPTGSAADDIGAAGVPDYFQVAIPDTGLLTVQAEPGAAGSLRTRLSLLGPDGRLLIQSDGESLTNPDDLIAQHLAAGNYFLEVQSLGGGTGAYTLTTTFLVASPPFQPLPLHANSTNPVNALGDAVGDLNGDGIPDLVISDQRAPYFSVLLGLGDGTFQKPVRYSAGLCRAVTLGDFNGDGHLDVAAANLDDSQTVLVFLGRGDGTFQPGVPSPVGHFPTDLVAGDFNGDGRLDLATANPYEDAGTVSVLLGRGDGTFQEPMIYSVGFDPFTIAAGDLEGDGRIDIVTENVLSDDVSVLVGNGDGTFQNEVRYLVGPNGGPPVLADFNNDGRLDLASPNYGTNDVSVLLGNGDGKFQPEVRYPVGPGPGSYWGFIAGDFNGDGRTDLITGNDNDNSLLLGNGDGTFEAARPFAAGTSALVAGDFNRDGRLDLVATTASGLQSPLVLLGLGDGSFQTPPLAVTVTATGPGSVVSGDFNGDGIPDLATANGDSNDLSVLLGRGDGTFSGQLRIPVAGAGAIVTADFNGDGIPDLATSGSDLSVILGQGDGTFQPEMQFPIGGGALVAGDFNGDGHIDLATLAFGSDQVSVLMGNGDGTFQVPVLYPVGTAPYTLVTGDFNGDGRLDLATGSFRSVSVLLGNGDGTFQDQQPFAVAAFPFGMVAGDFNRDRRLDLATSSQEFTNDVSVMLGNGDGTFQTEVQYSVGTAPQWSLGGRLQRRRHPGPGGGQPWLQRRLGAPGKGGRDV